MKKIIGIYRNIAFVLGLLRIKKSLLFLIFFLFFLSCTNKETSYYDDILNTIQNQYPLFVSTSPKGNKILLKSRENNFDLFVSDIDSIKLKKIDTSAFSQLSLTWHPSGEEIFFQIFNSESHKFDLYVLNIVSKERKLIELPASNNAIPPLRLSDSGKYLIYLASMDSTSTLFVYNLKKGKIIMSFDEVDPYSDFQWYKDSLLFFNKSPRTPIIQQVNISTKDVYNYNLKNIEEVNKFSIKKNKALFVARGKNEEYFQCYEINFKNGKIGRLTNGCFNVSDCTYSDNSPYFFFAKNENGLNKLYCSNQLVDSILKNITKKEDGIMLETEIEKSINLSNYSTNFPPNLLRVDLQNNHMKTVYSPPYYLNQKLSSPKFLEFENKISNSNIKAFLWQADNTDENISNKTILYVHGGPFLQTKPIWNMNAKILTKYGFNLLAVNYSGSSGYSKQYVEQGDVPHQISDIVACIDFLKRNYNVKEKDIILMGSSYGGKIVTKVIDYIDNIGGVVLVSGDTDNLSSLRLKKIKTLGFYGNLDPLIVKIKTMFNKSDLNNSKEVFFKFYKKEGHLFHKSSTWADIYNDIILFYSAKTEIGI